MAVGRIAGIASLKVDGNNYPLRGNFSVSPSPIERAGIAGQDRVHGFSENPRVPYIEGDISTTADVSVETLVGLTGVTVQAQLANGKNYVLRNGWTTAAFDINTHEGLIRVRFEGESCDEF